MPFKAQLKRDLTKYLPKKRMFQAEVAGNGTAHNLLLDVEHRFHRGVLYLQNVI